MNTFVKVKGLNKIFSLKGTSEYDPTSLKSTVFDVVDSESVAFIESAPSDIGMSISGHKIETVGETFIWTQNKIYSMPTETNTVVENDVTAELDSPVGHIEDGAVFKKGTTLTEVLQQIFTGDIYGFVGPWITNVGYSFDDNLELAVSYDGGTTWKEITENDPVLVGGKVAITVTPEIQYESTDEDGISVIMLKEPGKGILKYGYKTIYSDDAPLYTDDYKNEGAVSVQIGGTELSLYKDGTGCFSGIIYPGSGIDAQCDVTSPGDNSVVFNLNYNCAEKCNTDITLYAASKRGAISNLTSERDARWAELDNDDTIRVVRGTKTFPIRLTSGYQYFYKWGASEADVTNIIDTIDTNMTEEFITDTLGLTNISGAGHVGKAVIYENQPTTLNGYIILLVPHGSVPQLLTNKGFPAGDSFVLVDNTGTDAAGNAYDMYKFPEDAEVDAKYMNLTVN